MKPDYTKGLTLNKISNLTIVLGVLEILGIFHFVTVSWEFTISIALAGILHVLAGLGLPNYKKWAWFLAVGTPLILALPLTWASLVHPVWWYWLLPAIALIPCILSLQKKDQIFHTYNL